MNIEHISVSRSGVWDECRLKYKYQYHLKLEPLDKEPWHFTYGKIVHKIAEDYVSSQGSKQISESAIDVLSRKIPIEVWNGKPTFAPPLPQNYKERLPEHLRSIKTITEQIGMSGKLEHHFRYDLDPPNGKYVKGFIDRLIQRDDQWFVLDYKTTKKGKWRKDITNITGDLQLRMYARVVQKEFNVPVENIRTALLYLEGGELVPAKFKEHEVIEAEQYLLQTYNEIISTHPDSVKGNVGDHCRFCNFRKRCPFYNAI
ncbi:MAG: PD-(D/E)XK nuclease family protein [Crenarchaeota archaeon]|nr:MAG: PD-(D/E)XK nuclease family protein [Thermoproteota archaeon]